MNSGPNGEITSILVAIKEGQSGATQQLFSLVYDELKKIAKNRIDGGNHWSAETTTLVHEAYMRLVEKRHVPWADRHHFFWAAARAMRDILVERARQRATKKRGGDREQIVLDEEMIGTEEAPDLLGLHEALEKLSLVHPEAAKIVELKFFAGLGREQIAEMLELSQSAVWRQWVFAKAWLATELGAV